ncbi:MAG: DUF3618 domain-containing protein [Propionibacteriaceae bacterium]|nr:DUF3618 domain-containing protein [Propionibacteriaceae bacterium]
MSTDDAPRTVDAIHADLAASRARLVSSVSGLMDDVQPKNVAKRAASNAKTFAATEFENLKAQVKDDQGWRVDRLVALGGAVLGALTLVLTLRGIVAVSRRRSLAKLARRELGQP